jgi:hypothetical protein
LFFVRDESRFNVGDDDVDEDRVGNGGGAGEEVEDEEDLEVEVDVSKSDAKADDVVEEEDAGHEMLMRSDEDVGASLFLQKNTMVTYVTTSGENEMPSFTLIASLESLATLKSYEIVYQ